MSDDANAQKVPSSTYQRLAERFPASDHKRVNKGGRDQTYIPWTDKVERFNEVLGQDWSFRIVREGMTNTEAWVLGELSVTIDGVTTVRQQYGCEAIVKGQRETPTTDLFKIAGTDALSKAATLFGCGLYLSIQEERAEVEAEMRRPKAPPTPTVATSAAAPGSTTSRSAATPSTSPVAPNSSSTTATPASSEPTVLKTKAELAADLAKGLAYARSLGIEVNDVDPAPLNRAEIEETLDALRNQCRQVKAAKKAS